MAKRFIPILVAAAIVVGFVGGFYFHKVQAPATALQNVINKDAGQPDGVDFSTFWTAWQILHDKFVDKSKLDTQNLVYGAIDGMVKAAGDPYTVFFPPKQSESFAQQINGSFGGVGIEIGLRNNVITVVAPIKDSPAAQAGILAGDKIVKINDKSTEGMKLDDAVNMIRGPKGTQVKLMIARGTGDKLATKEYTLTRSDIKIPAVDWKLVDNDIAYVQLFAFNKNIDSEFKKAADEIVHSNARRIIIDLRNNPGGLLDSAVNLTGYFTDPNQPVVIEKFGDGTQNIYRTEANGLLKNYPVVIILNKGSASASEILSGALKDDKGVTIVGETSYGKGSVQEVVDLPKKASLKVTIAKWFTPKGTSINEQGIKPDVEVKLTEDDVKNNRDTQLDKAKELIRNLK